LCAVFRFFFRLYFDRNPPSTPRKRVSGTFSLLFFSRSKISRGAFRGKNVKTQMPLLQRVFCSFSAPFGALKPLGYFPEKSHFGGLFRCVSLWELFAFPHLHVLSFRISCSLRLPCVCMISRLYPSYSLVFVLFTSLRFFSLSSLVSLTLCKLFQERRPCGLREAINNIIMI